MIEELEVVKETAKATQELAKTASKVIGASEKVGGFISRLIKGPLEQGIGIWEDNLKHMRWERQQRLIQRADEFMPNQESQRFNRPIPLKFAVPLLQAASLEDDNYLQDMWAKLLVNSVNVDSGVELRRSYIVILEQLTSLEVRILEQIYNVSEEKIRDISLRNIQDKQNIPDQSLCEAMDNLMRLRLCIVVVPKDGQVLSNHHLSLTPKSTIELSTLGLSFIRACSIPLMVKDNAFNRTPHGVG